MLRYIIILIDTLNEFICVVRDYRASDQSSKYNGTVMVSQPLFTMIHNNNHPFPDLRGR